MKRTFLGLMLVGVGLLVLAPPILACTGGGKDDGRCRCGCQPPNDGLIGDELVKPLILFDSTGTLAFDAQTRLLSIQATLLGLKYNGVDLLVPIGSAKIKIQIRVCDCQGDFRGVWGPELVLEGTVDVDDDGRPEYQGVLLTGSIRRFGFEDTGSTTDLFDFRFAVTGGQMAGVFGRYVGVQVTSENSSFAGTFCESFSGGAKGTIGTVPGDKCPKSPGYWKTHWYRWPTGSLTIGGVTYGKCELLRLLAGRTPDGKKASNDMSVKLARVLIATKLSLLACADPAEIIHTVVLADAFLAANPPGSNPSDPQAETLKDALDAYLNSCNPCDGKDDDKDDDDDNARCGKRKCSTVKLGNLLDWWKNRR